MPAVLFTASTWSHIAHFHRPYLRAFHDLGWQVHAACGGASLPVPEADACFQVPFEKKMTAPANFRAQARLRALMAQYPLRSGHYPYVPGRLFHPPGRCPSAPPSGGGKRGPRVSFR